MIVISLPGALTKTPNANEHWRGRSTRRRHERGLARVTVQAHPSVPAPPLVVTLVRIAPHALDDDNLAGAFKAYRDGVADAIGIDDRDPRVAWRYEQRRGKPRERAVEIRIESRPA